MPALSAHRNLRCLPINGNSTRKEGLLNLATLAGQTVILVIIKGTAENKMIR